MATYQSIPAKLTTATVPVEVDFTGMLDSTEDVVSIATDVTLYSGVDVIPTLILSGLPSVSNNIATQLITGGTAGVIYLISFNALTNLSNELTIYCYLAVISDNMY